MAPVDDSPALQLRLLRELAQRLLWGGLAYALFASLFSLSLGAGVRGIALSLSGLLAVLGGVRTLAAYRVINLQGTEPSGRQLIQVTRTQSLTFGVFVAYAFWNIRGLVIPECLLTLGVAGLSSVGASLFAPFPRLAWLNMCAQVLPVYVWSAYALPRYGWLLEALLVIHAVAISQLIRMNGAHIRRMFLNQLTLEAQREDLRRATESLCESEERFRTAFEYAPFGMCLSGPQGQFLQVNAAFSQMLGYSELELRQGAWQDLTYPEDLERSKQTLEQFLRGRFTSLELEKRYVHKSGNAIWVRLKISVVKNSIGAASHFITHVEDIRERKAAEEVLRASEARFRALVENGLDVVFLLDRTGTVSYAGSSTLRVTGYSEDELTGRSIMESVHPGHLETTRKIFAQTLENPKGVLGGECRYLHKNGSWRWIEFTVRNLLDQPGVGAIVVNARDIDERKNVMAELGNAKEAAEAASRSKGEFLANMSHEIRTPMTGVLGMIDLALGSELKATQREYLETAQSAANSLLALLNDILDLSKIEAGRLDISPEVFSLRECVDDVIQIFALPAKRKGLNLTCAVGPEIADAVVGDPLRIRQILVNLLGNAIKFTDDGAIAVQVKKVAEPGQPDVIQVEVKDTGIGIAPDKQLLVFDPFQQVDGSLTRRHFGTGLGLTISARLAKAMGGRIGLRSELGSGSTFTFSVPLVAAAPESVPVARRRRVPADSPATIEPALRPLRILLAEDNPVNQKLISALLRRDGHDISIVSNGQDAVDAARKCMFDVILMDVQMPIMDGVTASTAIREAEKQSGRHTSIVALTAHAMKGDEEKCLAAGMDAYLSKPIIVAALRRTLASLAAGDGAA